MSKLEEIAKKPVPLKVICMAFPDAETLAFWRMTADGVDEYAARIARFSRAVGGKRIRNAVRSSGRRWRDALNATCARRSDTLGRVLVLPSHSALGSAAPKGCNARKTEVETESVQGGNMKRAPGVRAKKTGTRLARGRALQVVIYPRPKTKGALVEASREMGLSLSSFLILAALKEAAALRGRGIADLIPTDELEQYRTSRVDRKRCVRGK